MSTDQTRAITVAERAVIEANAKVADTCAAWCAQPATSGYHTAERYRTMESALAERTAALAALEDARKPKLLSPEEAWEIARKSSQDVGGDFIAKMDMFPALRAAHERAFAVIEALPKVEALKTGEYEFTQHMAGEYVALPDIKRALGLS